MKLYLRRQVHTTSSGMFKKTIEKSFTLYARVELTAEERQLVDDYGVNMLVLDYEYELTSLNENDPARHGGYLASLGSLVIGDEFKCPNIGILLEVQKRLQKGLEDILTYIELARDMKAKPETIVDIAA